MGTLLSSFKQLIPGNTVGMTTKPVTFILGATGTGKSDLAIALAKRFNGEIINADAMQIYQGLNIVTNKVTVEEQDGVPHHMLDILKPDSLSFTIHDFKKQATDIIDSLLSADKLPIVVGGTNYYLDSLLWQSLIPKHEPELEQLGASHRFVPEEESLNKSTQLFLDNSNSKATCSTEDKRDLSALTYRELVEITKSLDTNYLRLHIDQVNSRLLHDLLMRVDRDTAITMHPHTTRKIIRALEIMKQHGKSQSEFLAEINRQAGDQSFGAKLTYTNCVAIWLQCDKSVLDERLDRRIDNMMDRGLIAELDSFHKEHNRKLLSASSAEGHGNYTRGIFQCIGFKEFNDYLVLSAEERESKRGAELFNQGVTDMKAATRRYAKYQNKWVRKQFFEQRNPKCVPDIYSFDSSERSLYKQNVVQPSIDLLDEILRGEVPTQPRHQLGTKTKQDNHVVYETCEACGVTCVRLAEWNSHIRSRKHHKRLSSLRKAEIKLQKTHIDLFNTLTIHENNLSDLKENESGDRC